MSQADVECCVYQFEVPTWLKNYFCLLGVSPQFLTARILQPLRSRTSLAFLHFRVRVVSWAGTGQSTSLKLVTSIVVILVAGSWKRCRILFFTKYCVVVCYINILASIECTQEDAESSLELMYNGVFDVASSARETAQAAVEENHAHLNCKFHGVE